MSISTISENVSSSADRVSRWVLAVLMAVMVLDVLLGVFNRFLLKLSVSWTEELARFLMIWISMLGSAIALRKGVHVSITALLNMSGKYRLFFLYLNAVLLTGFFIFVGFFGFKLCISQAGQLSPALRLSMLWPLLAVPSGSCLMIIHIIAGMTSRSGLLQVSGFGPGQEKAD